MAGVRFIVLNLLVTLVVCCIALAVGFWWFSVSYVPQFNADLAAVESAQQAQLESLSEAQQTVVPDVVSEAVPSVVSIVISAEVPLYEQYYESVRPFGDWWGAFMVPRQRLIGTEEQTVGGGTGFFITADGYLVTNRHVVEDESLSYTVVTSDGATYPVSVVAQDQLLDIAVLRVDADADFPHLTLASAEPTLGESVIAIGNALAEFPNSVSVGVVSGLSRSIVAQNGPALERLEGVIQTDAAINQGNSGGPLLNTDGEVVGVNVAVAGNSENIGFAIPAPMVQRVVSGVLTSSQR